MPPEGKLEASGSPRTSSLPLNSATAEPASVGTRNESCFSAVSPVIGWNQWVKWVAPVLHGPLPHRGGDDVGDRRVERGTLLDRVPQSPCRCSPAAAPS